MSYFRYPLWSVLCTNAIVDSQTNLISLISCCDELVIEEEVPEFHSKQEKLAVIGPITLQLVTLWTRSDLDKPERGLSREVLITPDGKRFPQPQREISLENAINSRAILKIDKLPFRGLGWHYFVVEKKRQGQKRWTRSAKLPLNLKVKEIEVSI